MTDNITQEAQTKLMQLMQQQRINENMIIWQLDPKEIIEEIEHYLRGERLGLDPKTKKRAWEKWGDAMLPEEGIKAVVTELRARLNKVVVLSNLDDASVKRMAMDCRLGIARLLFMKCKDWKIDYSYLSLIVHFIDDQVYSLLMRARNDGEREKIYTTQQYVKQEIVDNRDQQKTGGFSLFKRKG